MICPHCGKDTDKPDLIMWMIRHPGNGSELYCETFEECMDKWFEGFNVPFKEVNGVREKIEDAMGRVSQYFGKRKVNGL